MAWVKVHVWMYGGFHYLIGNGHGSVEVNAGPGEYYYITWLNNNMGKSLSGPAAEPLGFRQIERNGKLYQNPASYIGGDPSKIHSYEDDEAIFGNRPRIDCDVPAAQYNPGKTGYQLFGVNVKRMVKFWKYLLALPPGHLERRYSLLSTRHNCDGVVVAALLEGGLDWYEPEPGNIVYSDGRTLIQWVQKAARRITEMNAQHQEIRAELMGDNMEHPTQPVPRAVPTYEDWKKKSDKGIAWYGQRKMQIAFIDDHIKEYWRAVQTNNVGAQFRRMFKILWYACDHLKHKAKSDRRGAVLWLAKRVQGALEDLVTAHDRRPVATNLILPVGPPPPLPPLPPPRRK
jgi:hypothetical protein